MSDSKPNTDGTGNSTTGTGIGSRSNSCCPGLSVEVGGNDMGAGGLPDDPEETRVTCSVLCSLGAAALSTATTAPTLTAVTTTTTSMSAANSASSTVQDEDTAHEPLAPPSCTKRICPKQHQLPMFLSKTYHMMDRCDPTIATWSSSGDNFVVKDVELFSTKVLPLYFKHSNFSSFARQLNFYGFRKLRSDPILTSEVDPTTSCFVRFFHEKFQKDKPELLHQIKRATKSSENSSSLSHHHHQQHHQHQQHPPPLQQPPSFSNGGTGNACSKDDVDSIRADVTRLRDCITHLTMDMDRKLIEMSYEYNKRITALSAEYDKLASLVSQVLASSSGGGGGEGSGAGTAGSSGTTASHGVGGNDAVAILWASIAAAAAAASGGSASFSRGTEWIQSLSRVTALRDGGGGLLPPLSSSTIEDTTIQPSPPPLGSCVASGSGGCLLGSTSTSKKRAAPAQEDETSSSSSGKRR